jgi:hypothetical protein
MRKMRELTDGQWHCIAGVLYVLAALLNILAHR